MIKSPTGAETRPTSAFLRESIFNMILNGLARQPRNVADLFAGTGSLGLEALSHGAERATFVEGAPRAFKILKENVAKIAASRECHLVQEMEIMKWAKLLAPLAPFDTAFCDPPYRKRLIPKTLAALGAESLWTPDALFVAEMAPDEELSPKELGDKWQKLKEKIHGDSKVVIYQRQH